MNLKFLLLSLMFVAITKTSSAQTKLDTLDSEISYIASKKYRIKSISFFPDSNWVVIYGNNAFTTSDIPKPLLNKLTTLNKKGLNINRALVVDTAFIILYDRRSFYCWACNSKIIRDLKNVYDNTGYIYDFSGNHKKYSIIYGNNEVFTNFPLKNLIKKIRSLRYKELQIKQIIFSTHGWLISYGRAGIAAYNFPDSFLKQLNKLEEEKKQIEYITKFKNTWYIVYSRNKILKINEN